MSSTRKRRAFSTFGAEAMLEANSPEAKHRVSASEATVRESLSRLGLGDRARLSTRKDRGVLSASEAEEEGEDEGEHASATPSAGAGSAAAKSSVRTASQHPPSRPASVISPEDASHARALCAAFPHRSVILELRELLRKYRLEPSGPLNRDALCRLAERFINAEGGSGTEWGASDGGSDGDLVSDPREGTCGVRVIMPVGQDTLGSYAVLFVVELHPSTLCTRNLLTPPDMFMPRGAPSFHAMLKTSLFSKTLDHVPIMHHIMRALTDQYYGVRFVHYAMSRRLPSPQLAMCMSVWTGLGRAATPDTNVIPSIRVPHTLSRLYWDGDCFSWCASITRYVDGSTSYESQAVMPATAAIALFASILLQVARGLASIHNMGLVHGDVKLENCLIDTRHGPIYDTEPGSEERTLYPYVVLSDFDAVVPILPESNDKEFEAILLAARYLGYVPDKRHRHVDAMQFVYFVCWRASSYKDHRHDPAWYSVTMTASNLLTRGKRIGEIVLSAVSQEAALNVAFAAGQRAKGVDEVLASLFGDVGGDEQIASPRRLLGQSYIADANYVGTSAMLAPELLDRSAFPESWCVRTPEADVWALAFSVWIMMTASKPIQPRVLLRKQYTFMRPPRGSLLSHPEAVGLYAILKEMLHPEQDERPTAEQIATNPRLIELAQSAYVVARPVVQELERSDPKAFVSSFRRRVRRSVRLAE